MSVSDLGQLYKLKGWNHDSWSKRVSWAATAVLGFLLFQFYCSFIIVCCRPGLWLTVTLPLPPSETRPDEHACGRGHVRPLHLHPHGPHPHRAGSQDSQRLDRMSKHTSTVTWNEMSLNYKAFCLLLSLLCVSRWRGQEPDGPGPAEGDQRHLASPLSEVTGPAGSHSQRWRRRYTCNLTRQLTCCC